MSHSVQVVVVLPWSYDGDDDTFWKIMTFPSMPAVGMTLWFSEHDDFRPLFPPCVIRRVDWWERWPSWYEVEVSEINAAFDDEILSVMQSLGWQLESVSPMTDHLDVIGA